MEAEVEAAELAETAETVGMAEVKVKCEEVIMRQNDKGNNFYLIKDGTCDVWVADASGERKNTRTLTAGSWCTWAMMKAASLFTVLSAPAGTPRMETISTCWITARCSWPGSTTTVAVDGWN